MKSPNEKGALIHSFDFWGNHKKLEQIHSVDAFS